MKAKDFEKLLTSIRQAGKIRRDEMKPGRVSDLRPTDIRAIRHKLGRSQADFALMIGVSVATLQNWEQGRRRPAGPAATTHGCGHRRPVMMIRLPAGPLQALDSLAIHLV